MMLDNRHSQVPLGAINAQKQRTLTIIHAITLSHMDISSTLLGDKS